MPPDNADAWALLHHDLMTPLTAVAGYTQLLQRHVLRAEGLSILERDLLLRNLASTTSALQQLIAQVHRVLPDEPSPSTD